jgi:hypothetical protein
LELQIIPNNYNIISCKYLGTKIRIKKNNKNAEIFINENIELKNNIIEIMIHHLFSILQ